MPPNNDMILEIILNDLQEIKGDLKILMELRWKIVGAVSVLSVVVSFLAQVYFNLPK